MFGLISLFDDVLRFVQTWKPKGRYRSEDAYRDDLKEFLRTSLNKPSPFAIGPQKRIKVTSESGRHLCDIAVDDSVGIELKKDLNELAKVDRLFGQIGRYKKQYSGIIVVLVGNTSKDAYEDLVSRLSEMQSSTGISLGFTAGPKITVINKSSETVESAHPRGTY
jgi:hypothetical protein